MKQIQAIKDANIVYLEVYDQAIKEKNLKFKYLGSFLNFNSDYFKKELSKPKTNYQKYKRGSIVFVDFGINVGNELSGNHLAVVLTKDDHSNNGLLTVIPLSSKNKPHYLPLGAILNKVSDDLISNLANIKNSISKLAEDCIKLSNENLDFIKDYNPDFDSTSKDNINIMKELQNKSIDEQKLFIEQMLQILNNNIEKGILLEKVNEFANRFFKVYNELKNITDNVKLIDKIAKKYLKKSKDSYAIIKNITSISKYKIFKPENKYDPINKICVHNDILDKIDEKIIELFTKDKKNVIRK